MKKQIEKIKKFKQEHEAEITKYSWYAYGVVVGITAKVISEKVMFGIKANEHPDWELILRDKKGYFHGFNRMEETTED